jgi:hypothetical protein
MPWIILEDVLGIDGFRLATSKAGRSVVCACEALKIHEKTAAATKSIN